MKRALFFLIFICAPWVLLGQKKSISYQAVILDPVPLDIPGNPISGQPLQKGKVTLQDGDEVRLYNAIGEQTDRRAKFTIRLGDWLVI
jgi:hypothetical protein